MLDKSLSPGIFHQRVLTISRMLMRMEPQGDQADHGEQLGRDLGTILAMCLQPDLAAAVATAVSEMTVCGNAALFPLMRDCPLFTQSVAAALVGPAAQPPKES